jgi:hypothetical protein
MTDQIFYTILVIRNLVYLVIIGALFGPALLQVLGVS